MDFLQLLQEKFEAILTRKVDLHLSSWEQKMIQAINSIPQILPNPRKDFLHQNDPEFVDRLLVVFELLEDYFRYEVVGLEKIPENKACLVVMNHGIIPFHGFLLTKKLVEEVGIYPRGLGADFIFVVPFLREFFLKGGAVNADPKNGIELLKEGNCVMLAPGGIYEGLVCEPGMSRIPWERRKGFVKLAIDANVPIIPTYCPAINDVYHNSKFLLKLRIKIMESIRFSLPLFYGYGLLPLRKKLVHYVGDPIVTTKLKGESTEAQINRIHKKVITSMKRMAEI